MKEKDKISKARIQMRKGTLEMCILVIVSNGKVYASDLIEALKKSDLLVVEGTLYPLLNRLQRDGLLRYEWSESPTGPPRKYYLLTAQGQRFVDDLRVVWQRLSRSVNIILKTYGKNN